MNQVFCQSCSMPMSGEDLFGTNKDGSRSDDYCTYCFKDGKFTCDVTMDEMIEICVPHIVENGVDESKAREMLNNALPNLKRWVK